MSEWYNCPKCGATRENMCACPNTECADGIPSDLTYTEPQLFIAHMGSILEQIKALRSRLKADPLLLPDIHSFLEMRGTLAGVESAVREFDRLLTVAHAGWLRRNYPDLATSNEMRATDWVEHEAQVQEYLAKHGPPDEATKATIDRTP